MSPLNGRNYRTLSEKAVEALESIGWETQPRQEFNPGLANRLLGEGLVRSVQRESPYKTRKGMVEHLEITAKGHDALNALVKAET